MAAIAGWVIVEIAGATHEKNKPYALIKLVIDAKGAVVGEAVIDCWRVRGSHLARGDDARVEGLN